MNSLVSIIIPTYNRANLILETLDSILSQTYTNWECIIVDDGSTDNSEEVIKEYINRDSRFQYFHRPDNMQKGANSCRNYGFECCNGEFLIWFDSDDIMLNNCLSDRILWFQYPYDIIISSGYYVSKSLDNLKKIDIIESNNLYKDYAIWKLHLLLPSLSFRKSLLLGKKLFDLNLNQAQESEFFCRFFFQNPLITFKILNNQHFLYRRHENSISIKDIEYIEQNQMSVAYFYLSNLKMGFKLKDKEIVNYFYKKIIAQWFRALENQHYINNEYILEKLGEDLKTVNKINFIKILLIFYFCRKFKLQSTKLRNLLKNIELKIE